jgi:hypothetical protein
VFKKYRLILALLAALDLAVTFIVFIIGLMLETASPRLCKAMIDASGYLFGYGLGAVLLAALVIGIVDLVGLLRGAIDDLRSSGTHESSSEHLLRGSHTIDF